MTQLFVPTIALFFYGYFILLLIFCLISLMIIYHLLRFGFFSLTNLAVLAVYAVFSFILIAYSLTMISGFDWSTPLFNPNLVNTLTNSINQINLPK